jgi:flagellar biosynthesis regulator FlbT
MDGPVITVRAGETLFFEGRMLLFETQARVMLPHSARFLRERDIVAAAEADAGPVLAAYLAVQQLHLAPVSSYAARLVVALDALGDVSDMVEAQVAARALQLGRSHHALMALRPLIDHNVSHEPDADTGPTAQRAAPAGMVSGGPGPQVVDKPETGASFSERPGPRTVRRG